MYLTEEEDSEYPAGGVHSGLTHDLNCPFPESVFCMNFGAPCARFRQAFEGGKFGGCRSARASRLVGGALTENSLDASDARECGARCLLKVELAPRQVASRCRVADSCFGAGRRCWEGAGKAECLCNGTQDEY